MKDQMAAHPAQRIAAVKKSIPQQDFLVQLAQLFSILADPTRLKILMSLRKRELCVHEITSVVGPSLSAVSHQLRILKTMRLVKFYKQGKEVYYTLDDQHVAGLIDLAGVHIDEQ